jgi:hypothetical protein
MKIIEAMILQQKYAKKWAGKVVAEMVKNGADREVMRRHKIPTSVFYCVLGGAYWRRYTVKDCADKMLNMYRHDYLYT